MRPSLREAEENMRAVAIMSGDEVSTGIIIEQTFSKLKGHFRHEDVASSRNPTNNFPFTLRSDVP